MHVNNLGNMGKDRRGGAAVTYAPNTKSSPEYLSSLCMYSILRHMSLLSISSLNIVLVLMCTCVFIIIGFCVSGASYGFASSASLL